MMRNITKDNIILQKYIDNINNIKIINLQQKDKNNDKNKLNIISTSNSNIKLNKKQKINLLNYILQLKKVQKASYYSSNGNLTQAINNAQDKINTKYTKSFIDKMLEPQSEEKQIISYYYESEKTNATTNTEYLTGTFKQINKYIFLTIPKGSIEKTIKRKDKMIIKLLLLVPKPNENIMIPIASDNWGDCYWSFKTDGSVIIEIPESTSNTMKWEEFQVFWETNE